MAPADLLCDSPYVRTLQQGFRASPPHAQIVLVTCTGLAVVVIHYSVRMYTAVNFWMPTVQAKRWFLERFSLLPLVIMAVLLLFVLLATGLAGATVNASPRLGLLCLICLGIALLYLTSDAFRALICTQYLHRQAHEAQKLKRAPSRASRAAWGSGAAGSRANIAQGAAGAAEKAPAVEKPTLS
jgi:hypothetical protein